MSAFQDWVFRQAIDQAYNAVLITTGDLDPPGPEIVYVNPALCEQTGYTAEELLGQTPRILQGPATDRAVLQRLRASIAQGSSFEGQAFNYRKDGTPYLVHWRISPVLDEREQITHYVSVQRDITERVSFERFNQHVTASLGEGVIGLDRDGRLTLMNQAALDLLGYTDEEDLLGLNAHELIQAQYPDGRNYPESESPINHVMQTDEPLKAWRDTFFRADGQPLSVESFATPLHGMFGEIEGVVVIFRDISRQLTLEAQLEHAAYHDRLTGAFNRHFFDRLVEKEIARSGRRGEPLSLLIVDIDHFKRVNDKHGHLVGDDVLKELVSHILERVRESDVLARWGGEEFALLLPDTSLDGAKALAESLRASVEATEFGEVLTGLTISLGGTQIWAGDSPKAGFRRADEALYKAKGSGRNRVCMASPPDMPASAPSTALDAARAVDTDVRAIERGARPHPDPDEAGNPRPDDGQVAHATRCGHTSRFDHCRSLLEASDDLFAIADADYRYLWANQAYCKSHGVSPEEIEGRRVPAVIGADHFERIVKPHLDRCFTGEAQHYEIERKQPGLGWRKLLVRCFPLDGIGSGERWVGAVITDVTEIREAEAELTRQFRLLSLSGRAARFGGWFVDLGSNHVEWSNVVAEIHCMPPRYSPTIEQGISFYAPEYRDCIRKRFSACAEQGVPFDEELEIIDANGRRVWVRTLGEPVRDERGHIVQVQGALQDVTSQRERERELRKLAHITDQSPAPIAVTDLDGRIEYVNPAFERISGYTSNELLGETPALVQGGNTPASKYRELWETIKSGNVWTGEIQNRSKDGSPYWVQEVISPLKDEQGQVTNYVAINQDVTALKEADRELSRIAYEDQLTGLYSRNGFSRHLQRWIDSDGWPTQGVLVMVDIVGLREINDAYGYEGGDRLLVEFGRRLGAQADEHNRVGRMGGDEFTLFLLPVKGEALQERLSRALESLSASFELNGLDIEISVRMGYTPLGEQQRPVQTLLREAERALFQHRKEPSAPWVAYNAGLQEEIQQRIELTRDLREALSEDQLELHFQPKVDLDSGTLVACEALLRWNHPERGLMSPGVFIPIAEQSQLIVPIGDWALRRACQHLRDWRDAGFEPVRVAVNVSVIQFQTGDFASRVLTVLNETGVAPEELALEITESVFERESELLLNQMRRLCDMGVWLSLDDFGTGYSSLLYLHRYPFNEIKIDQGFVFHLLDDRLSRNIVETVIMLAKTLEAEVIAEGIESAAVSDELRSMGCYFGQGFYFSMPLEAEDFRWLLEQRSTLPLNRPHSHKTVCSRTGGEVHEPRNPK